MAVIPGLNNFYQPATSTPSGFTLADIADRRSNAQVDYGQQAVKAFRDYGRASGDLVNRFSGQGAARSGAAATAHDRLNEDYKWSQGEAKRLLTRQVNDLDRQRMFALGLFQ